MINVKIVEIQTKHYFYQGVSMCLHSSSKNCEENNGNNKTEYIVNKEVMFSFSKQ